MLKLERKKSNNNDLSIPMESDSESVTDQLTDLKSTTLLSQQFHPFKCVATVILLGHQVESLAKAIHSHANQTITNQKTAINSQFIQIETASKENIVEQKKDGSEMSASTDSKTILSGIQLEIRGINIESVSAVLSVYLACVETTIQIQPPWKKQ